MRLEGERLEARVGAVDVSLHRDHPQGQATLVAEIRFPSLGLELRGGPVSGLSRLWSPEGVLIGGTHRVSGRDEAQVRALVLLTELELGNASVRRFDDERLVLERTSAGVTAEPVAALAASALALAAMIPKVIRALPPPTRIELAPWRELASALAGELLPARPSVEAELDGRRVEVAQTWEPGAVPSSVEVSVWSLTAIPERFTRGGTAKPELPSEVQAMVDEWSRGDAELSVSSERVTLKIPGTLADCRSVLVAAERVSSLVDALCRRGAYR